MRLQTKEEIGAHFISYDAMRWLGRGTAFPTAGDGVALAAGDRFFRTDHALEAIYDGTRWLTAHIEALRWPLYRPITATIEDLDRLQAMPSDFTPFVTRWDLAMNIGATNNASNYWQIFLRSNGSTTVSQTDTIGLTAGTPNQRRVLTSFTQPSAAPFYFNLSFVKNGSASNLEAWSILRYRFVLT